jgi:putative ABC transport system substrate-binding protein
MRRRKFITFLGGAAVAWPLSSRAKQSARVRRIGVLVNDPWPAVEGLHVGLDELGYSEGEDFLIEYRFAEGDEGRFPGLAAELVGRPVDVIVAWESSRPPLQKKKRQGAPAAPRDKRCNNHRRIVGCMLSGARRVHPVIVGWSTRK